MFPDSKLAEQFSCDKTECSYILCHGVAPLEALIDERKEVPYYTTLFYESYNQISQKSKMDLHIRFWDKTKYLAKTCYWALDFLGKASAEDVLLNYYKAISSLDKNKILQVSSDGPNVNWLF